MSVCREKQRRRKMGKYIKKTKGTGEVAVMEVSQECLGVRTRARTLALQKDAAASIPKTAVSYLQLRSRRLEKPPFPSKPPAPPKDAVHLAKRPPMQEPDDSAASTKSSACFKQVASVNSAVANSGSRTLGRRKARPLDDESDGPAVCLVKPNIQGETILEATFGENMLDAEARERSIRETTPLDSIRNSESLEAPGSTTRPTGQSVNNRRLHIESSRSLPMAVEIEEFFADAEQQQQRRFTEKYNYDPVNDLPLPGRYEWIRLNP